MATVNSYFSWVQVYLLFQEYKNKNKIYSNIYMKK